MSESELSEPPAKKPRTEEVPEDSEKYAQQRKLPCLEDLQPSDWFSNKFNEWRQDFHMWYGKLLEFRSPDKQADRVVKGAICKAPPQKPDLAQEKNEQASSEADTKQKSDEVGDDKDPMQQLEEEMDRADADTFCIKDVCDVGGGMPLFSNFAFEDWSLLSLRFELHLLVHAFMHDAKDAERMGIHPDHLVFYYNKYYKRGLNPKKYGVESLEDLIDLVKDTVLIGARTQIVESQLNANVESNEVFIKLTEKARRDRQRRIDAGDKKAALKFSPPARPKAVVQGSGLQAGTPSDGNGSAKTPIVVQPKQWNAKAGMQVSAPSGGGNEPWQGMRGGYNSWRGL